MGSTPKSVLSKYRDLKVRYDPSRELKVRYDPNRELKVRYDPNQDLKVRYGPNQDLKVKILLTVGIVLDSNRYLKHNRYDPHRDPKRKKVMIQIGI